MEYNLLTTAENPTVLVYSKEIKKDHVHFLKITALCKNLNTNSCFFELNYKIANKNNILEKIELNKKIISEILTCECYLITNDNKIEFFIKGDNQNIVWSIDLEEYII